MGPCQTLHEAKIIVQFVNRQMELGSEARGGQTFAWHSAWPSFKKVSFNNETFFVFGEHCEY